MEVSPPSVTDRRVSDGSTIEPSPRPRSWARITGCGSLIVLATWFGLLTGLLELGLLVGQHSLNESTMLGSLQMNRHYHWMVPTSQLLITLVFSLPLISLAFWRPTLALRLFLFFNGTVATFSLLKMVHGMYTGAAAVLAVGVGWQCARWLTPRMGGLRRVVTWTLPAFALGLVALGAFSYDRLVLEERRSLAALPALPTGTPNVLLIVLDTVRADHLSVYGYSRETTPNLERLARSGVAFSQARSAAPWTLPSHATLFTGRWPRELGVAAGKTLNTKAPTLAEALTARGYATGGFVGNTYFCNSWYGLGRGFAHYEDYYEENALVSPDEALRCTALGRWLIQLAGSSYNVRPGVSSNMKDGQRVNRDFLKWRDAHPDRPFFAFLNYIEAHDPYQVPEGFNRHFGLKPESSADLDLIRGWHSCDKTDLAPRQLALVRDAYDDCLSSLDEQLGRLFEELRQRNLLEKTLVIVTADHGEQLGERGLYGHGQSLYQQEVHVPLILAGPGIPATGQLIPEPVSTRDVAATVVDRLGMGQTSPFPGRSLGRFWDNTTRTATADDALIYSETAIRHRNASKARPGVPPALGGPVDAMVCRGLVYIHGPFGREQVYNLAADGTETHNLAGTPEAHSVQEECRASLNRLKTAAPLRR